MEQKTIHTTRGVGVFVTVIAQKTQNPNPRLDQIRRLDVLDLKTQLKQI